MSLFGGPSGSSGSGTGSTANVYTPMQQPQADTQWWNTLQPLLNAAANGGAGTPAGLAYPGALNLVQNYLTGALGPGQPANGPFAGSVTGALNAAQQAAGYGNTLFNQGTAGSSDINAYANRGLVYSPSILNNAFNPAYGNISNATAANPYYGGAIGGALQGANLGASGANAMAGAGNQLLQTGFDPQSALFNRTQQQLIDQSNVANSMAGVGNTPYGASVTSNALGNFDLNWQNNLLKREGQAALFASPLLEKAPGLAAGSAALPSQAFLGQENAVLQALNAQNNAGIAGGAGYNNMVGGALSNLSGAQGLGSSAASSLLGLSAAPYNMGGTIANNALSGLNNLVNLGNNQYQLPEQVLNSLQSYMKLGQSASGLSGQLGQMGFNQAASGIGGALSGANALFGSNGLFGGSGGLLGGGLSSGATDFGAQFLTGAGDFAGGGDLLGAAAGAGGDVLSSVAPLAFLGS